MYEYTYVYYPATGLPPHKQLVKTTTKTGVMGDHIESAERIGCSSVRVVLSHRGSLPKSFVWFAPAIDYRYELTISRSEGFLKVEGTTRHDGFPAYELYVSNKIANRLYYSHDPRETGESGSSLWGYGEHVKELLFVAE